MDRIWIVLFRGVGGATQLPVKPLRAALAAGGFARVETYINSGNAVVAGGTGMKATRAAIARICQKDFGFSKEILLASPDEWRDAIAANPFSEAAKAAPTTVHLFLLGASPASSAVETLRSTHAGSESFEVEGRFLYFHSPEGMGRSKLAPKIEAKLGVPMTARNWNTVLKLDEIATRLAS